MLPEAEDGPGAWKDSSQNFSTKKKKGQCALRCVPEVREVLKKRVQVTGAKVTSEMHGNCYHV